MEEKFTLNISNRKQREDELYIYIIRKIYTKFKDISLNIFSIKIKI